jgi:hypothetical protein
MLLDHPFSTIKLRFLSHILDGKRDTMVLVAGEW